ncbi:cohesin domain-containing protein [Clostridium amazonitimonense]|uniref:RCC1 domain-containing protein n=1 Tax=Clostridium amazonitimonense TaxID=1499689 RepID=UPI000509DF0F|nr:cohesin domain-containing protein [Clostridium amazonitimonense]
MVKRKDLKLNKIISTMLFLLVFMNLFALQPKAADNADLRGISINGIWVEDFKPGITDYNMDLPLSTWNRDLKVFVTPYDEDANLSIEGNTLVNGKAFVKIVVTSSGNTKKEYNVNVTLKDLKDDKKFREVRTSDFHTLALKNDGLLYSFGDNTFGQLGYGTKTYSYSTPKQVNGISDVVDFDTSSSHSIALREDGTVWVWGKNDYGQLDSSTTEDVLLPKKVEGLPLISKVRAGNRFSVVLDVTGSVWMWGYNPSGQFGDIEEKFSLKPEFVNGLRNIADIKVGEFHTLALDKDGEVYSFGVNKQGQLGDGTYNTKYKPFKINGLNGIKEITAYGNSSGAVGFNGKAYVWGEGEVSEIGSSNYPKGICFSKEMLSEGEIYLDNIGSVDSLSITTNNIIFKNKQDKFYGIGKNQYGELGYGYSEIKEPVEIYNFNKFSKVYSSMFGTFGIGYDGYIYAVGRNDKGQLGTGYKGGNYSTPQKISSIEEVLPMVYANHDEGFIEKGTKVTLVSDIKNADIYYTLDGTSPSKDSIYYKEPITIDKNTTVRAIAVKSKRESAPLTLEYYVRENKDNDINIKIDDLTGINGKYIEVPIYINETPPRGIYNLNFKLRYNSQVLEVVSVSKGDIIKDSKDFSYNSTSEKDKIYIAFKDQSKSSRNIKEKGTLALIKFKVKDNAPKGEYTLEFDKNSQKDAYDSSYRILNTFYHSGSLNIQPILYGDVDGDGVVTALDIQYIQRYILKKTYSFPGNNGLKAADIDGDGKITEKDLELAKQLLLKN